MVHSANILITDDDDGFRESLRNLLEPEGYRTWTAENGVQALEIVRHDPIDLLLLDMHMPNLTGYQTLLRVKSFRRQLPCILLSADLDDELRAKAKRADAFCVLDKPVSPNILRAAVYSALTLGR